MELPGWFYPDLQGRIVTPSREREQRASAAAYIHLLTRQILWALRNHGVPFLFDGERDLCICSRHSEERFRIPRPEQIFDFTHFMLTGKVFCDGSVEVRAEVWIPPLTEDYHEAYRIVFTTSCRLPSAPAQHDEE